MYEGPGKHSKKTLEYIIHKLYLQLGIMDLTLNDIITVKKRYPTFTTEQLLNMVWDRAERGLESANGIELNINKIDRENEYEA